MSENNGCSECGGKKADLSCGCCKVVLCKKCSQFLDEEIFCLMAERREELSHSAYCGQCFSNVVEPARVLHEDLVEKAKNISVFDKKQTKETRLISRKEKILQIAECKDYDEVLLRLAYLAAKLGFNALIDVEISSKKVRDGSYQTMIWSGAGRPANTNPHRVIKDRSIWQNPN